MEDIKQTAAQLHKKSLSLPERTRAAFGGIAGRNIDRFLCWSIENRKLDARHLINHDSAALEKAFVTYMKAASLLATTQRVYESNIRNYAADAVYFLPLLPRTFTLLMNDQHFAEHARRLLESDVETAAVEAAEFEHALFFRSGAGLLILRNVAIGASAEHFFERKARIKRPSRFENVAGLLAELTQHEAELTQALTASEQSSSKKSFESVLQTLRARPFVLHVSGNASELKILLKEAINQIRLTIDERRFAP